MPEEQEERLELNDLLINQLQNHSYWGSHDDDELSVNFQSLLSHEQRYTELELIGEGALKSVSKLSLIHI